MTRSNVRENVVLTLIFENMKNFKISFGVASGLIIKGVMSLWLLFFFVEFFAGFVVYGSSEHMFISFRQEIIFFGIIFSAICFFFLPLFNVSEYLQTQNVKFINEYKRKHKIDFVFLLMGFLGLACWSISKILFDVWWIIGVVFIVLSISGIFSISLRNLSNEIEDASWTTKK